MQSFIGDKESERLNLEIHQLALAIAKKTLDENHFKNTQKTMDRTPSSFQLGDRVYFKHKQQGTWDLKWRPGYRIVHIEGDGFYLYIENQTRGNHIMQCKGLSAGTTYWILEH